MAWETQIYLKKEVDREVIKEKCSNIEKKDPTFKWEIEDDFLRVYSSTYNKSQRRGLWLVNKIEELKEANSGYEVRKAKNEVL